MKCLDGGCKCLIHVTPETHVPVCGWCATPLVASGYDDTYGRCVRPRCPASGVMRPPDEWSWRERILYNQSDLPPHNGWEPIEIPEELL